MLKIGDQAPYFEGTDQNGEIIRLSDFKGRKLVLYFYPKDSTPGCTAEACDLRDNYHRFIEQGYAVVGVSRDSQASHQRFIAKYSSLSLSSPTRTPPFFRPMTHGARKRIMERSRWALSEDICHRRERCHQGHCLKSGYQEPHRADSEIKNSPFCGQMQTGALFQGSGLSQKETAAAISIGCGCLYYSRVRLTTSCRPFRDSLRELRERAPVCRR